MSDRLDAENPESCPVCHADFVTGEACLAWCALGRLQRETARLRKAFLHTHVAGPDGDLDTCRECGLDLRNPIHRREEG